MKECIMDVKLVNEPTTSRSDDKEATKSGELGSWRKGFLIVNAFNLSIALSNKMGFIVFKRAIRFIFNLVNPFTTNGFVARR
jgi:hypothetical protein